MLPEPPRLVRHWDALLSLLECFDELLVGFFAGWGVCSYTLALATGSQEVRRCFPASVFTLVDRAFAGGPFLGHQAVPSVSLRAMYCSTVCSGMSRRLPIFKVSS